jgi:CspA family cold shock protein
MTKGTVKMFNSAKGFGFITCEDGTEVFFHHSAVQGADANSLKDGQAVEFQMGQGPKGKRAEGVKLLK